MPTLICQNLVGGINLLDGPRDIAPLALDGITVEPCEAVQMENMEPSGTSIITSPGFVEHTVRGSGTGGVLYIKEFELDNTTRNMVIVHDDDIFEVVAADTGNWTSVGDYGTVATNVGGVVYKGTASTRRMILGNDISGNTTQVLTASGGTVSTANLGGTPPDGYIMAAFQGRLFLANINSPRVDYTNVEDQADWAGGGNIQFNDIVLGLWPEDETLIVGTRKQFYEIHFQYNDSAALSVPLKRPSEKQGGVLSHKSLLTMFSDVWYLGNNGIESFGFQPFIDSKNRQITSPSAKILPLLKTITPAKEQNVFGFFKDKRAMWACPLNKEADNNILVVYDHDYQCWFTRTNVYASALATLRNADDKEELYFGSSISPKLFKFVPEYTYAGSGYDRIWKSKIFNFGSSLVYKDFKWLELQGSMPTNTTFYVDVTVDNNTETFIINSDNLLETAGGGYYADSFYSSSIYGGGLVEDFYRFGARLELPSNLKEGLELQFKIYNSAAGEPFKVDSYAINYERLSRSQIHPSLVTSIS